MRMKKRAYELSITVRDPDVGIHVVIVENAAVGGIVVDAPMKD